MLLVVGGHSRNIGKTSVAAGLIRALPQARWTAVKITQFGHGVCAAEGAACDCTIDPAHPYALTEETRPSRTDSGRFLAAGAARSWWLRTAGGELGHAMPALRRILDTSANAILESNRVLQFLAPDLYVVVLDFAVADMKDSTRLYFDRADAFVLIDRGAERPPWGGIPARWLESKPQFRVTPQDYVHPDLIQLVAGRLGPSGQAAAGNTSRNRVPVSGSD